MIISHLTRVIGTAKDAEPKGGGKSSTKPRRRKEIRKYQGERECLSPSQYAPKTLPLERMKAFTRRRGADQPQTFENVAPAPFLHLSTSACAYTPSLSVVVPQERVGGLCEI